MTPDASHIYNETYCAETSASRSVSTRLDSTVHTYNYNLRVIHGDAFQTNASVINSNNNLNVKGETLNSELI